MNSDKLSGIWIPVVLMTFRSHQKGSLESCAMFDKISTARKSLKMLSKAFRNSIILENVQFWENPQQLV